MYKEQAINNKYLQIKFQHVFYNINIIVLCCSDKGYHKTIYQLRVLTVLMLYGYGKMVTGYQFIILFGSSSLQNGLKHEQQQRVY